MHCIVISPAAKKLEDGQAIRVELSQQTQILHVNAEVQARRVYIAGKGGTESSGPTSVTRAHSQPTDSLPPTDTPSATDAPRKGPRRAVNEGSGEKVNTVTPPES